MITGNIFVTVDTTKQLEYVVNEKICKSDGNEMIFMSNSFEYLPNKTLETQPEKEPPDGELPVSFTDAYAKSISLLPTLNDVGMPENDAGAFNSLESEKSPIKEELIPQHDTIKQGNTNNLKHGNETFTEYKDGKKIFFNVQ